MTKFKKGQWYTDGKQYCQYIKRGEDADGNPIHYIRPAGDVVEFSYYVDNLTPASLTPDFTNAKVGDECFSVEEGLCKIMHGTSTTLIAAMNEDGGWDAFTKDGKLDPESNHPLLFNSFAQFQAYWAEKALEMGGKS